MKKISKTYSVHAVHPAGAVQLVQAYGIDDAGETVGGIVSFTVDEETAKNFPIGTAISVEIGPVK